MARTFTATVIGGVALLVTAGAAGLPQLPARADGASAVQPEPSATVTSPARVLLTFDVPTSSDPSDPCNGLYAKNNHVGDHDELTACTFDSNGNPVATDSSGFHLRWEIAGDEANGVTLRFNPDPPP